LGLTALAAGLFEASVSDGMV